LVGINTEIEALESKIFEYYDRKSIIEISNITRSVIHIERSVRTHAPIIERLETIFEKLSSGSLYRRNYVVDLYSEVTSSLTTNRDILIEMRWTHNGLLTYQTNNTLMVFTMISFLALPIAVVSSSLDLLQSINNFSLREAVMIGIAIAMGMILYFFHRNRWI
jgi:Mg2+ and Co2+ transporter CorA